MRYAQICIVYRKEIIFKVESITEKRLTNTAENTATPRLNYIALQIVQHIFILVQIYRCLKYICRTNFGTKIFQQFITKKCFGNILFLIELKRCCFLFFYLIIVRKICERKIFLEIL